MFTVFNSTRLGFSNFYICNFYGTGCVEVRFQGFDFGKSLSLTRWLYVTPPGPRSTSSLRRQCRKEYAEYAKIAKVIDRQLVEICWNWNWIHPKTLRKNQHGKNDHPALPPNSKGCRAHGSKLIRVQGPGVQSQQAKLGHLPAPMFGFFQIHVQFSSCKNLDPEKRCPHAALFKVTTQVAQVRPRWQNSVRRSNLQCFPRRWSKDIYLWMDQWGKV